MTRQASLKPFFSLFGGKWRTAYTYPEPKYPTIVEPFAGSAGYSLRYPDRQVILVDKDPRIVGAWRWIIEASQDEIRRLPSLLPGESVYDYDLPQGARWLLGYWTGFGRTSPCVTQSPNTRSCDWPSRVAEQVEAIRHWRVIEGDYAQVSGLGKATWFVDPPYQKQRRQYDYGANGISFTHLGAWCRSRQGQVIVCEQDGADWLPFEPHRAKPATWLRNRDKKHVQEVCWVSDSTSNREAA